MLTEERLNEFEVKKLIDVVKSAPHAVKIVAATKTRTAEEINGLKKFGITAMGENRVQELLSKYDELDMPEVHFIGALQTNKVKYIVDKVCMIQSVDRLELALEIEKRCAKINKVMDVLIEVNYGEEENKSGCPAGETIGLAREISALPHLRIKGLMTVLPIDAKDEMYSGMKMLSDELKEIYPEAEYLSMGMSDDYEKAISYGANMIRPGTALFGARVYPQK
ncbi:MAG: YggS family pyridoxal phosphate-dependent enzyme [Clostridia bacterium]|nr:YggS family pyridoxal phosphate-dependent enzyme [Clostridia bacterium]